MKAFEIAGRRAFAKVTQGELADRMGWATQTLRDVEQGAVDITSDQFDVLSMTLSDLVDERAESVRPREAIPA